MCNDIHIEKSNNKVKIASYLLIFATFVLFLIRCFFGFDWSDETYYSAISYRLCLGDELFKENWDIHQLSAIITLPLVYLYKIVTGGTDGLILFMRISYTICQFATILYVYNCCKKRYKNYVSLLIATFLTFIPFAIRSFSYNTLSLLFLNLSLFLLFDAKEISKKTYKYFLSGLALALAILAYPFLIMVLPITVIYILVGCIRKKTITLKAVLLYFAGGISVITAFVAYVATNTSLSNIVKYAKFLFLDPEHQKNASISATKIIDIFSKNNVSVIICLFALIVLTILYNKIGNKKEKIKDNLLIFIILAIFLTLTLLFFKFYVSKASLNLYAIPLTIIAPFLYFISEKKSDISILFYFVGLVFAFSVEISSNNGIMASSYPMIITSIATIMYFFGVTIPLISNKKLEKISIISTYIPLISVACFMVFLNLTTVYRDNSLNNLTCKIKTGSASNLYTTSENAKKYEEIINTVNEYIPKNGTVFYSKLLPFGYLESDLTPAVPRLWRTRMDDKTFEQYYEINPHKLPNFIFIVNENYGQSNSDNEMGEFINKYISNTNCVIIRKKCGTIYLINN